MRNSMILAFVSIVLTAPAWGETYVVRPDGGGDYPTIQAAINAAVDGDVIELTDGTFTGAGNRDVDYQGKALTILSQAGNPAACTIDCQGSKMDPHRGFLFHSEEGPSSEAVAITIRGGYTDFGGAIYCSGASPSFRECVFRNNVAETSGGGIRASQGSHLSFEACHFTQNEAQFGGGLDCVIDSAPVILGCTFSLNSAFSGGAIRCVMSPPVIEHSTFSGNDATRTGAVEAVGSHGSQGPIVIAFCTFTENSSVDDAAALQLQGPCSVRSSTICFNSGGVIAELSYSGLLVEDTIIALNPRGVPVTCAVWQVVEASCCNIYGNAGGDWVDCIADQYGINGNISADPLFCDPENGDFTLHEDSPCAPFTPPNEECDLIGAWPVGCEVTAIHSTSWGGIKAMFR